MAFTDINNEQTKELIRQKKEWLPGLLRRGWITGKSSNGKRSEGNTYNLMGKYIIRSALGTLPEYEEISKHEIYVSSGDGHDAEEGYYGYGMWIIDNPGGADFAYFQGCDPGVSFLSEYNPNNGIISVLVSNYGDNVWKEMRKIREEKY